MNKSNNKDDLEKIIMTENIYNIDEKILFKIIPELKECAGFEHKHPQHCYDVWEHTKKAMSISKTDLQIRLTLLLHDIGKPHSYQEGKIRHFKGHPEKSAEMSEEILKRIGYEQNQVNEICYLIKNHDTLIDIEKINLNNLKLIKKLLYIQYCDSYSHAPEYIEKRIKKLNLIHEQLIDKENELIHDKMIQNTNKIEQHKTKQLEEKIGGKNNGRIFTNDAEIS